MSQVLIECVPNFSEGRNPQIIEAIAQAMRNIEQVHLLDIDAGKATNRTVMTLVGPPEAVVEAAFQGIKKAAELIDMRQHQGEHPRMGATDVCPLIPVSGISMEETANYARKLAQRVGEELNISVFLYEAAASDPRWRNLANIRAGEYEKMAQKLETPDFVPDFGPSKLNLKAGVTAIGARDFLIAYNVNLNTTSVRRANSVAFDVREQGRILRQGDPITGPVLKDEHGEPLRQLGACKAVKAIGWYIEEYGLAQVSMNLTNPALTSLHEAFDACCVSAQKRGMRVTGSELVGMLPLRFMLEAGRHYLRAQERSAGVSDRELIHIAVKSMGLDQLSPFEPEQKIIEYALAKRGLGGQSKALVDYALSDFADLTASEAPAPGGGSVAAYLGALAAALGTMVANLSSHKRGWDQRWAYFSDWAEQGQSFKKRLLYLVDEDTKAFQGIMQALQLPKTSQAEKEQRKLALAAATRYAVEIPFETLQTVAGILPLLEAMIKEGNPNSLSDAAVGVLALRAAALGAFLNVKINLKDFEDKEYAQTILEQAQNLIDSIQLEEQRLWAETLRRMDEA